LAAVHADGIHWLRLQGGKLAMTSITDAPVNGALACFLCPRTNELLVLRAVQEVQIVRIAGVLG
jgi:hypothetical protein